MVVPNLEEPEVAASLWCPVPPAADNLAGPFDLRNARPPFADVALTVIEGVKVMNGKTALLCPVPCVHMDDAIATTAARRRVAFGSQVEEMFYDVEAKKQLLQEGLRVLIYVSQTGDFNDAARRHDAGRISYEATYLCWSRADDQGKHCDPTVRPVGAHGFDTAFMGFWEVSGLKRLEQPKFLSDIRTDSSGKITSIPRRPMLVRDQAN